MLMQKGVTNWGWNQNGLRTYVAMVKWTWCNFVSTDKIITFDLKTGFAQIIVI